MGWAIVASSHHHIVKFKTKKRGADILCIWKKLDTKSTKFHNSITTNGVVISFRVRRPQSQEDKEMDIAKRFYTAEMHDAKRAAKDEHNVQQMAMVRENWINNQYDALGGLDPGCKLMMAGLMRTRNAPDERITIKSSKRKRVVLSNRYVRQATGEVRRRRKLIEYTADVHNKIQVRTSAASSLFVERTEEKLAGLEMKQELCTQRPVTRLNFEKKICLPAALHKMVKEKFGRARKGVKKTLIFRGDATMAPNSPIRSARLPACRLLEALRVHCEVVMVDGYRTSQTCNGCHSKWKRISIV